MKWFKHDSNASIDAKLKRVRLKYGMEGYGLYWYCLELVAQTVEIHNLTFELEHDAELIAMDTGIHQERVQEMMTDFVKWNLFESDSGIITCLKMATRADEYTQKLLRKASLLTLSGHSPDKIPPIRTEENRLDKNKKKYTDDDLSFANKMFTMLDDLNIGVKKPNLEKWACEIRLIRERDDRTLEEITEVFIWANNNDFWQGNIRSPAKLRKQWSTLISQMKRGTVLKFRSEKELVAIGMEKGIEAKPGESNAEYAHRVKKEIGDDDV